MEQTGTYFDYGYISTGVFGTAHTVTISELLGMAEGVIRRADFKQAIVEPVDLVDLVSKVTDFHLIVAELLGLLDSEQAVAARVGVFIDERRLDVKDVAVGFHPATIEKDKFVDGNYKRAVTQFGYYMSWEIEAVEETSTSWADSMVKYLQDKILDAESVELLINRDFYSIQLDTCFKALSVSLKTKVRRFTIRLQEA